MIILVFLSALVGVAPDDHRAPPCFHTSWRLTWPSCSSSRPTRPSCSPRCRNWACPSRPPRHHSNGHRCCGDWEQCSQHKEQELRSRNLLLLDGPSQLLALVPPSPASWVWWLEHKSSRPAEPEG